MNNVEGMVEASPVWNMLKLFIGFDEIAPGR